MSRSTDVSLRVSSPLITTSAALTLTLACLQTSALTFAQAAAARELVPAVIKPVEPTRPKALVGRWCGLGLCLTLSESGATLIHQIHDPQTTPSGEPLERGLWWVEGPRLCLSAGLESICEPYLIDPSQGTLTLKGVPLKRQAP